eukprot:COSAG01_NODE_11173_length_1990_cov_9.678477_3_plen_143_part_00
MGRYVASCTSGANSGNRGAEEYNTPTYDLVAGLRARRLRWLGHILRSDATRLLRQIVLRPRCKRPGSIWKDTEQVLGREATTSNSTEELVEAAQDRPLWRVAAMAIIPEEQRPKGASVFIPEDRELHAAWKELSRDERTAVD